MKLHFLIPATLVIAAQTAWGQVDEAYLNSIPVENVFKTADGYRYVLPPVQAFYGAVTNVIGSSDSKYLVFFADPQANRTIPYIPEIAFIDENPTLKPALYVYNAASRQSRAVLQVDPQRTQIQSYSWLTGTKYLTVIESTEDRSNLLVIDPDSGQVNRFSLGEDFWLMSEPLWHAASRSIVLPQVKVVDGAKTIGLQVIDTASNRSTYRSLGKMAAYRIVGDGEKIYQSVYSDPYNAPKAQVEIDPISGRFTEIQPRTITTEISPYLIWPRKGTIAVRDTRLEKNHWPDTEGKSVEFTILTNAGLEGGVSADNRYAWFVDRSGLNICDFSPITLEQYTDIVKEIVKRDAVNRGKQIGTAMMIYGADYDDQFPPVNNWQELVNPYVKNNSLFNGFTYMLNGEKFGDIRSPSEKILGTIETPFGTAVVYADTHTIWKDRPKPTYQ